ncbi:MAG: FAD-dependent oxidoreductase, partial [Candidatus Levybacteria bacterium]|nr:FAD-dependent oxidoreductase [Candidatus Levybacteria bacterium]
MYDVIIIGSGPAGLTAAIYTTRANLKTLVLAGSKWGGQLQLTSVVENFPGFPEGIEGPELMLNMRKQAEKHGAEVLEQDFVEGDFGKRPFAVKTAENVYQARTVIVASGADAMWLGVPGEEKLIGRGVSSCATCDAAFFKEKNVIVIGGGDSAMEEALVLAR